MSSETSAMPGDPGAISEADDAARWIEDADVPHITGPDRPTGIRAAAALLTVIRPWQLRAFFWILAIALGALNAWAAGSRQSMNADGISYLDMGEAYLRGDWGMAINPVWSPFYSWLLGLSLLVIDPPVGLQFPTVHLVNFFIYLAALGSFDFFLRGLVRSQQERRAKGSPTSDLRLPEWTWIGLGYSLFIWSSLYLIEMWAVTPDMCVAAFVYLAAGLILRILAGTATWPMFALLGVVLGFGYLSKAAMFPLAFIFLSAALLSVGSLRKGVPLTLVGFACFLAVAGPFVAALSTSKGRLTFGEIGNLTYARHVNGIPYPHWQGEVPNAGTPVHPTRKIHDMPAVYEFGSPIGGTYPISYDPSYWYEGLAIDFDLRAQAATLLASARFYLDVFFRHLGGVIVGLLVLYLVGRKQGTGRGSSSASWSLIVPALAALGMYAPVLVEGRYIGAFVVLLLLGLLAGIRLPATNDSRRLVGYMGFAMALVVMINIVAINLDGLSAFLSKSSSSPPAGAENAPLGLPSEVAQGLGQLGIERGDKVAVIGYSFDAFWARLAGVQIVAETYPWEADRFAAAEANVQAEVIAAFAKTEAKAVIAERVPSYSTLPGWSRIGETSYYLYSLLK